MPDTRLVCTFHLDGALFGVDVMRVQEVTRYHDMTPVPLARAVGGLINLRGQIVTAIDTRSVLRMRARGAGAAEPMNVVVDATAGIVSLLVDDVGDVIEVSPDAFEPPPATMTGATRELLRGVYKLQHGLLLLLDVERVAQRAGAGERAA